MNDESLSALLDGECSLPELERLLETLDRDPAARQRFSRLCLARDGYMGTRVRSLDLGLADRVQAAIAGEPTPVEPTLRRFAPVAAAAVVAAVAILSWRPEGTAPEGAPVQAEGAAANPGMVPDEYLLAHSQSRAQQGMGGALAHARYAAYAGQPPAADDGD